MPRINLLNNIRKYKIDRLWNKYDSNKDQQKREQLFGEYQYQRLKIILSSKDHDQKKFYHGFNSLEKSVRDELLKKFGLENISSDQNYLVYKND